MNLYKSIGKIVYIFTYPGIRLMLWRSNRVYVIINYKNSVFVTKNWLGLHKSWRLPGGGIKKNEEPIQAVMRELNEELGYQPEQPPYLATPQTIKSHAGYKYSLFVLEPHNKPKFAVNNKEIVEYAWLNTNELTNHPCSEELEYVKSTLL